MSLCRVGSYALRVVEHLWDGEGGAPIPGLRLWHPSGVWAREHISSALYGFTELPPGKAQIQISDPQRRYGEQWLEVQVPDRRLAVGALEQGLPAPEDYTQLAAQIYAAVALRPAWGAALPAGQTVIDGVARDAAGGLLPYALVQAVLGTRQWSCTTDLLGRYQLWLRGLPASLTPGSPISLSLRAWGRRSASPPLNLDGLLHHPALIPSFYPLTLAPLSRDLPVGSSTRMDPLVLS